MLKHGQNYVLFYTDNASFEFTKLMFRKNAWPTAHFLLC